MGPSSQRPVEHPTDASVTSDRTQISISGQGTPGEPGGHSQLATSAQGDLSHTRPSWATDSLTEGDLIVGANNQSAIVTLVERATRYVMLGHLPSGHTAEEVRDVLVKLIGTLPEHLRGSLTWDQGAEMAAHKQFTVATGVPVYFCDPHSPWQRGSNENTNGLLRQYFPKSTDLTIYRPEDLEHVAQELNGRPRKTLDWDNPAERLRDLLLA